MRVGQRPSSPQIQDDLRTSSRDLVQIVFPSLQKHQEFARGSLHLVEGASSQISRDLDILAGIDAYHRTPEGLRGIASRLQYGTNYQTFTIRLSRQSGAQTEYRKRLHAVRQGYLYPFWTLQAYLSAPAGSILGLAVAKTAELLSFAQTHRQHFPAKWTQSGECFLPLPWKAYRQSGRCLFVTAPLL